MQCDHFAGRRVVNKSLVSFVCSVLKYKGRGTFERPIPPRKSPNHPRRPYTPHSKPSPSLHLNSPTSSQFMSSSRRKLPHSKHFKIYQTNKLHGSSIIDVAQVHLNSVGRSLPPGPPSRLRPYYHPHPLSCKRGLFRTIDRPALLQRTIIVPVSVRQTITVTIEPRKRKATTYRKLNSYVFLYLTKYRDNSNSSIATPTRRTKNHLL